MLAAAAFAAALLGYTPRFKWSQTAGEITLNLELRCATAADAAAASVTDGVHFRLECGDTKGRQALLDFELRESVVPPSGCKQAGSRVQCRLTKEHPHHFDRLAWDANILRGVAAVDFDKLDDDDDDEAAGGVAGGSSALDYAEVDHVPRLTADALRAAREHAELVVVDVAYPWCDLFPTVANFSSSKFT